MASEMIHELKGGNKVSTVIRVNYLAKFILNESLVNCQTDIQKQFTGMF